MRETAGLAPAVDESVAAGADAETNDDRVRPSVAARELGLGHSTVLRWVRTGAIAADEHGLVDPGDVQRELERRGRAVRHRYATDHDFVERVVKLYDARLSGREIGRRLGISHTEVYYLLAKAGRERRDQPAATAESRRRWWADRRARGIREGTRPRTGRVFTCARCGRERYVPPSWAHFRWHSLSCWTLDRLQLEPNGFNHAESTKRRWILHRGRTAGRHAKGVAFAAEVGRRAVELVGAHRNALAQSRSIARKLLIDQLIREFVSDECASLSARDPRYRAARERVMVALRRAHTDRLVGTPDELLPLLASPTP